MMSLYLYFHLLHSNLGLKCNIYTHVVACVADDEHSIVGSSLFTVYSKAEKQDDHELSIQYSRKVWRGKVWRIGSF